jgi:hypothetical protein
MWFLFSTNVDFLHLVSSHQLTILQLPFYSLNIYYNDSFPDIYHKIWYPALNCKIPQEIVHKFNVLAADQKLLDEQWWNVRKE